jgi:hypothetical protein
LRDKQKPFLERRPTPDGANNPDLRVFPTLSDGNEGEFLGGSRRGDYSNGYYEHDFVTRFGTLQLRVARTRGKSALPRAFPAEHRPMVCFVNVESGDRIICSIFQRFNLEWKSRTLKLFTQAA